MEIDRAALKRTLANVREKLLCARNARGFWQGHLSGSALSTATAVCALFVADQTRFQEKIEKGLAWLGEHQNPDGGFGDTIRSQSNLSTTTLCWAVLSFAAGPDRCASATRKVEQWLTKQAPNLDSRALAKLISDSYGKDRTFSVPILTMCAICGCLGTGKEAWRLVKSLPFELAAMPHALLRKLRLTVVSYALPALVAIGQARHYHLPTANPFTRLVRDLTRQKTLNLLGRIQPESGGFLEAVPLTSFVVMSLAASGQKNHEVVKKGTAFLKQSMREDGSWPIDTNLATWVTTLSVNSLAQGPGFFDLLDESARERVKEWLLDQQYQEIHPYTRALPGGWAWTDLSGGVPDADDTAGALIALFHLGLWDDEVEQAVTSGIQWLVRLQNRDGGVPTFRRGWGKLPFDRSAPDLTAHALLALFIWSEKGVLDPSQKKDVDRTLKKGVTYLRKNQRKDGAWIPLWFGNESALKLENPVYGTARVLSALAFIGSESHGGVKAMADRGAKWLIDSQNRDGGWGGARGVPSSIEETSLAVFALSRLRLGAEPAVSRGINWLIDHTVEGKEMAPAPMGLYFARLWYYEELYPVIFALQALEQAARGME
jgi:squalene-hopene/tetraprenyl-beta-curcumene cyclase